MKEKELAENPYERLKLIQLNTQLWEMYRHYPKFDMKMPEGYDPEGFDINLLKGQEREIFDIFYTTERYVPGNHSERYDPYQVIFDYQQFQRTENSAYLKLWKQKHDDLLSYSGISPQYKEFIKKATSIHAKALKEEEPEEDYHLGLGSEGTAGIFDKKSALVLEKAAFVHEEHVVLRLAESSYAKFLKTGVVSEAFKNSKANLESWRQEFKNRYDRQP